MRWARVLTRIMGMRIRVSGSPPAPPFFLVANHLSYMDILLLYSQINCVFVSRGDVENWPIVGFVVGLANTLFIDRSAKKDVIRINGLIAQMLQHNDSLIVFPEGTTTGGDQILPFKPSLLEYPAQNNYPVHYATIQYRTPPGEPPATLAICWWGKMALPDHLFNLLKLPCFEANLCFGATPIQESDRKLLADQLRTRILENFQR